MMRKLSTTYNALILVVVMRLQTMTFVESSILLWNIALILALKF